MLFEKSSGQALQQFLIVTVMVSSLYYTTLNSKKITNYLTKSFKKEQDGGEFLRLIQQSLSDINACSATFVGSSLEGSGSSRTEILDGNGSVLFKGNCLPANIQECTYNNSGNSLILKDILIRDYKVVDNIPQATVFLSLNQLGQDFTKRFKVAVQYDTDADKLVKCVNLDIEVSFNEEDNPLGPDPVKKESHIQSLCDFYGDVSQFDVNDFFCKNFFLLDKNGAGSSTVLDLNWANDHGLTVVGDMQVTSSDLANVNVDSTIEGTSTVGGTLTIHKGLNIETPDANGKYLKFNNVSFSKITVPPAIKIVGEILSSPQTSLILGNEESLTTSVIIGNGDRLGIGIGGDLNPDKKLEVGGNVQWNNPDDPSIQGKLLTDQGASLELRGRGPSAKPSLKLKRSDLGTVASLSLEGDNSLLFSRPLQMENGKYLFMNYYNEDNDSNNSINQADQLKVATRNYVISVFNERLGTISLDSNDNVIESGTQIKSQVIDQMIEDLHNMDATKKFQITVCSALSRAKYSFSPKECRSLISDDGSSLCSNPPFRILEEIRFNSSDNIICIKDEGLYHFRGKNCQTSGSGGQFLYKTNGTSIGCRN